MGVGSIRDDVPESIGSCFGLGNFRDILVVVRDGEGLRVRPVHSWALSACEFGGVFQDFSC